MTCGVLWTIQSRFCSPEEHRRDWHVGKDYAILFGMSSLVDFNPFLATPQPPDLGPGPRAGVQSESDLSRALDTALRGSSIPAEKQRLIRALILLWHDHLDAGHELAQSIEGADGAFVHGIMHRREPDSGNAAYWFRRVGRHPAFAEIARRVAGFPAEKTQAELFQNLIKNGEWDPFAFINECGKAAGQPISGSTQQYLREVQRLETEALLAYFAQNH